MIGEKKQGYGIGGRTTFKILVSPDAEELEFLATLYSDGKPNPGDWSLDDWARLFKLSRTPQFNQTICESWCGREYLDFVTWMGNTGPLYAGLMESGSIASEVQRLSLEITTDHAAGPVRRLSRL